MNPRLVAATVISGLAVLVPAGLASAHPLGNVTVNTSASVVIGTDRTSVDYVLDLAELPALQARQRIDADGNGDVSPAEADAYRASQCTELRDGLAVTADGTLLALTVTQSMLTFPPGQAGLATLRLECQMVAPVAVLGSTAVTFSDRNLTDRTGWREVTMNGDGVTLRNSTAPTTSTSNRLLAYPTDAGATPRVLSAQATASTGGPRLATVPATGATGSTSANTATGLAANTRPQARGSDGLTQALSGIVGGRRLGVAAGALALGIALLLGGLHSLAPGHGKSLMAAAVVGRRGTGRQVLAIGATVAITHTTGVLVLGMALWLSQALAPDRLLPWLTAASGALLALAGLTLLLRRLTGRGGHHHPHPHPHEHPHPHDDAPAHPHPHEHPHPDSTSHEHPHPHPHEAHAPGHSHGHGHLDAPSRRWLVTMGMAGGLVPTPSALVVLLGATALGRAWFGVVLVGAYGVGMALTLLGAGLLLVRIQGWLERRFLLRPWWSTLLRVAPLFTAAVLVASGLMIAARGLATA